MVDFRTLPRELRFLPLLVLAGPWLVFTGFRDEEWVATSMGIGITVIGMAIFLAAVAVIKELRQTQ